jgi:hypothetical protein
MSDVWPFKDPPNVAVFTSRDVIELGQWIYYVSHDLEDGAWQFHSLHGSPSNPSDARVVLLKNIFKLDPSLGKIADLPRGWIAWRKLQHAEWQRALKTRS